jgi:hypothetical protein
MTLSDKHLKACILTEETTQLSAWMLTTQDRYGSRSLISTKAWDVLVRHLYGISSLDSCVIWKSDCNITGNLNIPSTCACFRLLWQKVMQVRGSTPDWTCLGGTFDTTHNFWILLTRHVTAALMSAGPRVLITFCCRSCNLVANNEPWGSPIFTSVMWSGIETSSVGSTFNSCSVSCFRGA